MNIFRSNVYMFATPFPIFRAKNRVFM
jgi:hypothetical protein